MESGSQNPDHQLPVNILLSFGGVSLSQGDFINIAQQAVYTALLVSAPVLGLGLAVGLLVSIIQAATQINEQTMSFISKILAVAAALIIFGPWMLSTMVEFTTRLFENISIMVQ